MALRGDTDMNYEEATLKTQRFPQPKYVVNCSTLYQHPGVFDRRPMVSLPRAGDYGPG